MLWIFNRQSFIKKYPLYKLKDALSLRQNIPLIFCIRFNFFPNSKISNYFFIYRISFFHLLFKMDISIINFLAFMSCRLLSSCQLVKSQFTLIDSFFIGLFIFFTITHYSFSFHKKLCNPNQALVLQLRSNFLIY